MKKLASIFIALSILMGVFLVGFECKITLLWSITVGAGLVSLYFYIWGKEE